MSYLSKDSEVSLVNIKLTDKGREFLAAGFKDDNIFDIVKFSLGDSEVDYTLSDALILSQQVLEPTNAPPDIKKKIYSYGTPPNGTPVLNLDSSNIVLSKYGSGSVIASTIWGSENGSFSEEYSWINLGPLKDYDFNIVKSTDTKTGTISAFDTTGTTTIKVMGISSGAYSLFTLTINN